MPRAVITGGAGFLGSHLCRRLLAERMAYPILVDARNALDRERYLAAGFTVAGMGRPVVGRDRKGR